MTSLSNVKEEKEGTEETFEKGRVFLAVKAGDVEMVRALAKAGGDVNESFEGIYPVQLAVLNGDVEMVRVLAKAGAKLDKAKWGEPTSVQSAVKAGDVEMVRALAEAGANLDEAELVIDTPIHLAVALGNIEMLDTLYELGASMRSNYKTIAHVAAEFNKVEVIKLLTKYGVDPDGGNKGFTPMYLAVKEGNIEAIGALVDVGADPNKNVLGNKFDSGVTPMYIAVEEGSVDAIKALVESGVDPNEKIMGEIPIHIAAKVGNVDTVRALVEEGAYLDAKSIMDNMPVSNFKVLEYLCSFEEVSSLHEKICALVGGAAQEAVGETAGDSDL